MARRPRWKVPQVKLLVTARTVTGMSRARFSLSRHPIFGAAARSAKPVLDVTEKKARTDLAANMFNLMNSRSCYLSL
jgi:hypothetical protein